MGAYDGAEIWELADLFLLNNLANKFDKNSIGIYRDNGLALFKNINDHRADERPKEFHQLFWRKRIIFKNWMQCNNTGAYKP